MRRIFMDHASTTPVDKEVLDAMLPYFDKIYGNPSSQHKMGQEAKRAIEESRETIAKSMNAKFDEIVFTGSSTEADNLAVRGTIQKGDHIITSSIEHNATLKTCKYLEKCGVQVTYLPVNKYGEISTDQLINSITNKTKLITISLSAP